jgi:Aldehyde dehydrogenase family
MPSDLDNPSFVLETSTADVDAALSRLAQHKQTWLTVPLEGRLSYLENCIEGVRAVAESWVAAACAVKGLDPNLAISGEEWLAGPFAVLRYLRLLRRTLVGQLSGRLESLQKVHGPTDRDILQPFPSDLSDRLLFRGMTAQVWGQPGHPLVQKHMKSQPFAEGGGVALVLGAGNISSIGPLDVLHQLFIENRVALLKMNPVNAAVGPWIEKAFAGLSADGFFAIAYGGAELGAYLCQHPTVDAVHITGAQQTHDAIVWGSPAEQPQRKATGSPLLHKPITSELGGVTPILVVPGQWSDLELDFQARHVASMVVHNASFNCVAGQVLVLSSGWTQRSQFLDRVRQQLRQIPPRLAYYPGAQARYRNFLKRYPNSEVLGQTATGCIPWTLIPDVPPIEGEYALTTEAFCGLLAEVTLVEDDADPKHLAKSFLERAVQFANDCLYGTLSCTILIDPKTQRHLKTELQQAIAQLRYGTIGIDIWSGTLFIMPEIPWGAFPGNSLADIGSGQGFVHNTCLVENPQKAVVSAPFYIWPIPVWFAQHKTLKQVGQRLVSFESDPNLRTLGAVMAAAIGG